MNNFDVCNKECRKTLPLALLHLNVKDRSGSYIQVISGRRVFRILEALLKKQTWIQLRFEQKFKVAIKI